MMKRKQIQWVLVALLAAAGALPAWPQSRALHSGDVQGIYQRLLEKIKSIKIFDHHAHPGYGDDSDVDAQATPPQHLAFRQRETNPELVAAVKALFDYPYSDMSEEHLRWLQERSSAAEKGRHWLLGPHPRSVRHRVLRSESCGHGELPEPEKVPLGVLCGLVPFPLR
jgi:hypothetical protein